MITCALDDFVSLHISIIILLGQYVKSLAKKGISFNIVIYLLGGRIQTINYSCIQQAVDRSTKLTEKFYGMAPTVNVFFAKKLRYIL